MSRSSKSASCKLPASTRARIEALRSAVIHSRPAGLSTVSICLEVIMPRSPTRTMRLKPKRSLSLSTCVLSVVGSPVLPSNTSTATGQPVAEHSRPNTICSLPDFLSRLWPCLANGQVRPSNQVEVRS
jgi:hypothetical protein